MAHHYDHYAAEEWAAHGGDYQISVNNTYDSFMIKFKSERQNLCTSKCV